MNDNPLARAGNLYVAFEKSEKVRNNVDHQIDVRIPDEPGTAHAYRLFTGERSGEDFYEGLGPAALCGARIHARTAQKFPADDPDACEQCAEIVKTGRRPKRVGPPRPRPQCGARLPLDEDDWVHCSKDMFHPKEHRAPTGETWETGHEMDYTPAPDGFV